MRKTIPALFVAIASLLPLFGGNDWPQWRGPNRDGISKEKGLLQEWPKDGPKLTWKSQGLGSGYATIVTSGDKIFTSGERDGASVLIALNRPDGKYLWHTKLGDAGEMGGFEGPRSTPTADGNLVFAVSMAGDLVCVDASTGKEKWRKNYEKDFGGAAPGWGYSESPLVDGDRLVFTPGGSKGAIVALNKNTGETVWQSRDFKDPAHYSSLVPAKISGTPQYVQFTERSVVGIGAEKGDVLWRTDRRGATAVIPTPLVWDNFVYVTSGYGIGCNLFEVSKDGSKLSAKQVYANKVMVNHHGGVVRIGANIYGYSDGKGWTCQDFKTGAALWQDKQFPKGSLVYADNRLYLRAEGGKGTVVLIEASPQGFKEHGRLDQPDRKDEHTWAHPVVSDGKLYLRDADILLCYDIKQN
jgi:outer membrane protein assembly factor BamB